MRQTILWTSSTAIAIAAALTVAASPALAATLLDCQLVLDGSTDPPGDRIDCAFFLADGDKQAQIEVRAFAVADEPAVPEPVKSSDPALRGDDGSLVIRAPVAAKSGEHSVKQSLVVPYAAIDLPAGTHRLGYEVQLLVKGEIAWTQPLALTTVRIGKHDRKELAPRTLKDPHAAVDQVLPATVASSDKNVAMRQADVRLRTTGGPRQGETVSAVVPRGFERAPSAAPVILNRRLADLAGQPWRSASDTLTREQRTVYFATNRGHQAAESSPGVAFDASKAELAYGQCVVNFPIRAHRRGRLERPGWWGPADPEKHFLVETVEMLERDGFFEQLGPHDVLVFVHGFANNFDDAVLCTAQLAYDVNFQGKPMTFCWPSAGIASTEAYPTDEKQALASAEDLADVLAQLTANANVRSPPGKVHLLAHSMGNKLALQSIYTLIERGTWKPEKKRLGQVILAAPDVGAATFNNLLDYVTGAADRVTYYYCRNDMALGVSQQVNRYEPVGMYPYFERGLDTINVEGAGTDFLAHSYYSSSIKILADFELLLTYGLEPSKRIPPLGAQTRVLGHDHWSFLPLVATMASSSGN